MLNLLGRMISSLMPNGIGMNMQMVVHNLFFFFAMDLMVEF
jgi:hypothetical protein